MAAISAVPHRQCVATIIASEFIAIFITVEEDNTSNTHKRIFFSPCCFFFLFLKMNSCKSHPPLIFRVRQDSRESITRHIHRPNDSHRELVNKFMMQTIFLWLYLQCWGLKVVPVTFTLCLQEHQFLNPIAGGPKHNLGLQVFCLCMSKQIYSNFTQAFDSLYKS